MSIIAKQHGNTLAPYETEAGDHLELFSFGEKTPEVRSQFTSVIKGNR